MLLVTYYWPPSGGVAVQRWLKMSRHFKTSEVDLTIYTPDLKSFPGYDDALLNEIPEGVKVIKTPILEPHDLFKRWMKSEVNTYNPLISEGKSDSWKKKVGYFIRGNFFIPDARCLWIKPSVKYLTDYLSQHEHDVIITTGPPHSMHLIGLGVKKRIPAIKWVADFRDPWTQIYHFKDFFISYPARKLHEYLEKKVLKNADEVVTVSPTCARNLAILAQKEVQVVSNGYSEEDFMNSNVIKDNYFTISYVGSINAERNPINLWRALSHLAENNSAFKNKLKIIFAGLTDSSVTNSIKEFGLSDFFEYKGQISHPEAIKLVLNSDLLLLTLFESELQNGVITGKFFEYLRSGIPILALGNKKSDVAAYLEKYNAGQLFEYDDLQSIEKYIIKSFEKQNNLELKTVNPEIKEFNREELAIKYINILNKLTNKK